MNTYKKKILKEMFMALFMIIIGAACVLFVISTIEIFTTSPAVKELLK